MSTDIQTEKGATRLGIWFFSPEESRKRPNDYCALLDGRLVRVSGARYAVWRYRLVEGEWRRLRRVTGPLRLEQANQRLLALAGK